MDGARRLLGTPFGSALAGGLVVLVFGWIAISAGWIEAEGSGPSVSQAPLTRPASDKSGTKQLTVNEIYSRASEGVVHIESEITQRVQSPLNPFPQEQRGSATGSGFVIDGDGHVLTNAHVVEGASKIRVTMSEESDPVGAEVVGRDPSTDLALLKVDVSADQLHPLQLADSGGVQVGDPVVAIGNPFGLDRTATSGIVSALQREIQAPNGFSISDVIQTDAPINPGNSGGPLLDAAGRVVGINSQIETGGGNGSVGIGFAVPINTARDAVSQLLDGGEVHRAYLGVTGADLSADLARELNLPTDQGVLVQEVVENGPADSAGIRAGDTQGSLGGRQVVLGGDIITKVDGDGVNGMDDVINVVNEKRPGDEITLTILRGEESSDVKVTLGERPEQIQDQAAPLGQ
jgi:S1-C subfamily serine protease